MKKFFTIFQVLLTFSQIRKVKPHNTESDVNFDGNDDSNVASRKLKIQVV